MSHRSRRGLSLIEFIVILFIIAVLFALLLPATRSARGPARRTQCLNNMRNVGLAIQNYASQHTALPPSEDGSHAWPRLLLKVLDYPALDREITSGNWSPEKAPPLQVFTCPEDEDSFQQSGGLSYVVNAGYGFFPADPQTGAIAEQGRHSLDQDWDGDGTVSDEDRLVTKATGVFWRPHEAVEPTTLDYISQNDGTGNTLLITENLHAGPWTSRDARALVFVMGRERLTFDKKDGLLAVADSDLGPFAINGAKEADGPAPAPSSRHTGSVNVIFADGHGSSLSDALDPSVYVRLLTTAGSQYGQQAVEDSQY